MAETLIPDKLTTCTVGEVFAALAAAWARQMGSPAERASLLVLVAHWSFETASGRAMHNFNLGNAKHVAGDGRNYCRFRCNEIQNGKTVWLDCDFRAFDTLDEGVDDYFTLMRGQFRYAWPAVVAGDPVDFCHRLKVSLYYTADEAIYTRGIVRVMHELDAVIPRAPVIDPTLAADAAKGIALALAEHPISIDHDPPEPPPDDVA